MQRKKPIDFDLSTDHVRQMPGSVRLEKTVLAQILNRPALYSVGYKYLKHPGIFLTPENDRLWNDMVRLSAAGAGITAAGACARYQGGNDREMMYYVLDLINGADLPSRFEPNCLVLNQYWIQRSLFKFGYYVNQHALRQEVDSLALLGEAEDTLGKIFLHIAGMKEKTVRDGADELKADVLEIQRTRGGVLGVPSSIAGLNEVIQGYRKGNLIIVGASTHEGKTTLALQETRNLIEQGRAVGYVTLEMKQSELLLIMACDALGLSTKDVLSGQLTKDQIDVLFAFLEQIKSRPLHMVDKAGLRVGEIKAIARMWKKQHGIEILFIDHMHLVYDDIDHSTAEPRFTNVANKLKELAKEIDIPVIALAQLTRKEKSTLGGDKSPRQHVKEDLKYAGGIEQAADVVLLIYRPELHGHEKTKTGEPTKGQATIIVDKLRLMPANKVWCHFTGLRFVDYHEWKNGYWVQPTIHDWGKEKKQSSAAPGSDVEMPF